MFSAKVLKVRGEYDKAMEYLGYADGMSINSLSGISKDDIERLKKEITDAQG